MLFKSRRFRVPRSERAFVLFRWTSEVIYNWSLALVCSASDCLVSFHHYMIAISRDHCNVTKLPLCRAIAAAPELYLTGTYHSNSSKFTFIIRHIAF